MQLSFLGQRDWAHVLLRVGLAFVFLYAAMAAFITPDNWVGYLPHFLTSHFSAHTLLDGFSVFQVILAGWLLSGIYVRYAALVCAAMLIGIVITSPSQFLITFRDVGLIFMALALAVLPDNDKTKTTDNRGNTS